MAITLAQATVTAKTGGATTIQATFGSSVTTGSLLVCTLHNLGGGSTPTGVADT